MKFSEFMWNKESRLLFSEELIHLILGTNTRSWTEFPKNRLQTRVHRFVWSEAATLPDVQLDFTCLKVTSGFKTELSWIHEGEVNLRKTFTSSSTLVDSDP